MCFTIHLLLLMCFQQLTLALEELEAKKTKEDQRVKAKKIAIQNQLDEAQEKLAIDRNKEHELRSEVERCDKSIKDIDDVVARSQKDQYQNRGGAGERTTKGTRVLTRRASNNSENKKDESQVFCSAI